MSVSEHWAVTQQKQPDTAVKIRVILAIWLSAYQDVNWCTSSRLSVESQKPTGRRRLRRPSRCATASEPPAARTARTMSARPAACSAARVGIIRAARSGRSARACSTSGMSDGARLGGAASGPCSDPPAAAAAAVASAMKSWRCDKRCV